MTHECDKGIKSILVVDDNEGDHFLSQIAINDYQEGIKIYTAYDGAEALKILSDLDEPPTLILLDINMPRMNGLEFLEHYNSKKDKASIVAMLSSSAQESDKCKAMVFESVKHYLVKPLEPKHLIEIFEHKMLM